MGVSEVHGEAVKSPVIGVLSVLGEVEVLGNGPTVKGRAWEGEIDQDLPECGSELCEPAKLLQYLLPILIGEPYDHGRKYGNAPGLEGCIELTERFASKFIIARFSAFDACPDNVKAHFGNLVCRELGEAPYTAKAHDAELFAVFANAL